MQKYQRKRVAGRRITHYFSLGVLLLAVILLARSVWNIYQKQALADNSRLSAVRRLNELEERKTELEAELLHLSTERGIEEELRTKFPVAKEGEGVVVIIDEENDMPTSGVPEDRSLIERFKSFFR